MVEIRVMDLFGAVCVDPDDGTKLCNQVHQILNQGDKVCLDFSGVTTLASLFLNTSVGCLYAFFPKEDLDQRLLWKGLDPTDESVMRFVQRNAIRFYSAKKPQQDVLLAAEARHTNDHT